MTTPPNHSPSSATSTGLEPNVAGALAYLLGPITGIAFLVLERENRFVRYHAAHSIAVSVVLLVLSVVLSVLSTILAIVPILGWLAAMLLSLGLSLGSLALWLVLMWKAYHGEEWEPPITGPLARKLAG